MVTSEKIEAAVRLLSEATRPARIILFGWYARGWEITADELERFGARLESFLVDRELCATGCNELVKAIDNGRVRE